jgi:hypothetical protein
MESNGQADRIHVAPSTAALLQASGHFDLTPRGEITIKGKGSMSTFWLNGVRISDACDDIGRSISSSDVGASPVIPLRNLLDVSIPWQETAAHCFTSPVSCPTHASNDAFASSVPNGSENATSRPVWSVAPHTATFAAGLVPQQAVDPRTSITDSAHAPLVIADPNPTANGMSSSVRRRLHAVRRISDSGSDSDSAETPILHQSRGGVGTTGGGHGDSQSNFDLRLFQ